MKCEDESVTQTCGEEGSSIQPPILEAKPACISDSLRFQQQFAEKVSREYSRRMRPELTKAHINDIIDSLKEHKKAKEMNLPRTKTQINYARKYDLGGTETTPILLLPFDKVRKTVLPSEDYYDVLLQMHLKTNHGSVDQIKAALNKRCLHIPKIIILLFARMNFLYNCPNKNIINYVRRSDQISDKHLVKPGIVELFDFEMTPDGEFKWVLYYEDQSTKFCVLRPLRTEFAAEVAKELLNIFFEIGFPSQLQCKRNDYYVDCVITEMNRLWPYSRITTSSLSTASFQNDKAVPDVKAMIYKWIWEGTCDSHWATKGIYLIQYKLNCTPFGQPGKIPFKQLFDREPIWRIKTKPLPLKETNVDEFDQFLAAVGQSNKRVKCEKEHKCKFCSICS